MKKKILLTLIITMLVGGCGSKSEDMAEYEGSTESMVKESEITTETIAKESEEVEQTDVSGDEDTAIEESTEKKEIDFEYFYRGFTPVGAGIDDISQEELEEILGGCLILSEEDWIAFEQKYCPPAGALSYPDFDEKCFYVEFCLYGAKSTFVTSSDIEAVEVQENHIYTRIVEDRTKDIWALNTNGIGHLFMNIIVLNRSDIPTDVDEMIYSR